MKNFNLKSILVAIAAGVIFFIVYSNKVSTYYVLPVLGILCLIYGIFGIRSALHTPPDRVENSMPGAIMQCVLGVLLMALGIIEAVGIELSSGVWNAALGVIIVIALVWLIMRRRGSR